MQTTIGDYIRDSNLLLEDSISTDKQDEIKNIIKNKATDLNYSTPSKQTVKIYNSELELDGSNSQDNDYLESKTIKLIGKLLIDAKSRVNNIFDSKEIKEVVSQHIEEKIEKLKSMQIQQLDEDLGSVVRAERKI